MADFDMACGHTVELEWAGADTVCPECGLCANDILDVLTPDVEDKEDDKEEDE